jgi:hypothetical protein
LLFWDCGHLNSEQYYYKKRWATRKSGAKAEEKDEKKAMAVRNSRR